MATEDPDYLAWVRRQRCAVPGCESSSEAHHPRHDVGLGLRAHDHRAIPLCHQHHAELHGLCGYFKGWSREQVRAFCERESAATRARYLGAAGLHVETIPF